MGGRSLGRGVAPLLLSLAEHLLFSFLHLEDASELTWSGGLNRTELQSIMPKRMGAETAEGRGVFFTSFDGCQEVP